MNHLPYKIDAFLINISDISLSAAKLVLREVPSRGVKRIEHIIPLSIPNPIYFPVYIPILPDHDIVGLTSMILIWILVITFIV